MPSRWLVTGAQGFVGRYVCANILARHSDASVLGIGRSRKLSASFSHVISGRYGRVLAPLPAEMLLSFASRYSYQPADVSDRNAVASIVDDFRPNYVIHLASALKGDASRDLARSNVAGTRVLAGVLREGDFGVSVLVLGSSGGIYGASSRNLPIPESTACLPTDEYSKSKLEAEQAASAALEGTSIRLVIARIFNVIGAGQDERHIGGKMAVQFTSVLEGHSQSLELGDLGSTRDFIDVSDVARALICLAEKPEASGPVNVANGQEISMLDLLNHFRSVSTVQPSVMSAKDGPCSLARQCADISRLSHLGFRCTVPIRQSVQSLLRYYKEIWDNGPKLN